jgi:hypothetical protein
MKRNLWPTTAISLAGRFDKDRWKAIEYLKEWITVLNSRVPPTSRQTNTFAASDKDLTSALVVRCSTETRVSPGFLPLQP